MKISACKINSYQVLLFFLLSININFFYLLSGGNFFGISIVDFTFLFNILVFIWQLFQDSFYLKRNDSLLFIGIILLLFVISAVSASANYYQGFLDGIMSQRLWLSWMFLMYPILRWLESSKISVKEIKDVIVIFSNIYALICILQFFLYNKFQFTSVVTSVRYGSVRLYFNTVFLILASSIVMDSLFNNKNKRISIVNILELFSYLFVIFFVTKGRMQAISFLLALTLCVLLRRKISFFKKVSFILLLFIALLLFFNTPMGQEILNLVVGKSIENDTLSIRDSARQYYWKLVTSSWKNLLFGLGTPNINNSYALGILNPIWSQSVTARYYLDDVGVMAILIRYGLFGIISWISVLIYNIVLSFKIYGKTGELFFLQFLLVDIFACWTLIPTMFNNSIAFPLVICLISYNNRLLSSNNE